MIERRHDSGEEPLGPVVQPDTVLPAQFFSSAKEKSFVEGEKRLMAAVLTDAVECYMKYSFGSDPREHHLFSEAEAWLFEGGMSSTGFFSFLEICDVLRLEPEYVRRGLTDWRSRRAPTQRVSEAFRRAPSTIRSTPARELKKAG
jgi:hypothetical protein